MRTPRGTVLWVGGVLIVLAGILGVSAGKHFASSPTIVVELERPSLPADGHSAARVKVTTSTGRALDGKQATVEIVGGSNRGQILQRGSEIWLRAGVLPGRIELEARARGYEAGRATADVTLEAADFDSDGFPDVLRLDSDDQRAFRGWFTYLAEAPAFMPADRLPAEINDCGALLRFAYREALREHNGEWAGRLSLPGLPDLPPVEKYRYPYTLLGANLFRVREGRFQPADLSDGSFAQFADAQTLQRLNSVFVSRDINRAEPGDLLFYRQLAQDMPFHAMVLVGVSHFEADPGPWVVYHTGPSGKSKGEIRRVRLAELLHHPEPRWRPVPGNRNFLGVYRWKILGGAE